MNRERRAGAETWGGNANDRANPNEGGRFPAANVDSTGEEAEDFDDTMGITGEEPALAFSKVSVIDNRGRGRETRSVVRKTEMMSRDPEMTAEEITEGGYATSSSEV